MENILNELCDDEQIFTIALLVEGMQLFTGLLTVKVSEYIVQVDGSTAETAIVFIQKIRESGIELANSSTKIISKLGSDVKALTKNAYYDVMFTIQSDLLPAIKGVEALMGEELQMDGVVFSEALADLLSIG
jgi:hypothetical protein